VRKGHPEETRTSRSRCPGEGVGHANKIAGTLTNPSAQNVGLHLCVSTVGKEWRGHCHGGASRVSRSPSGIIQALGTVRKQNITCTIEKTHRRLICQNWDSCAPNRDFKTLRIGNNQSGHRRHKHGSDGALTTLRFRLSMSSWSVLCDATLCIQVLDYHGFLLTIMNENMNFCQ
jgi:hypothetical protein